MRLKALKAKKREKNTTTQKQKSIARG